MNILGIDTSTRYMSIALISDEMILGELLFNSNMEHSEKLITNLSFLLESNGLKMKDIGLIGVAKGPGSFTGIRIGIATVKGLAEFLNIPVVGVSSLEVLSRNFILNSPVAIAIDAKRDRVYGAIYDYSSGDMEILLEENLYNIEEFEEYLINMKPKTLAGDINERFIEKFGHELKFSKELTSLNHGTNTCFIAKREFEKGNSISHHELNANYMSKSQAQMDMEKKNERL